MKHLLTALICLFILSGFAQITSQTPVLTTVSKTEANSAIIPSPDTVYQPHKAVMAQVFGNDTAFRSEPITYKKNTEDRVPNSNYDSTKNNSVTDVALPWHTHNSNDVVHGSSGPNYLGDSAQFILANDTNINFFFSNDLLGTGAGAPFYKHTTGVIWSMGKKFFNSSYGNVLSGINIGLLNTANANGDTSKGLDIFGFAPSEGTNINGYFKPGQFDVMQNNPYGSAELGAEYNTVSNTNIVKMYTSCSASGNEIGIDFTYQGKLDTLPVWTTIAYSTRANTLPIYAGCKGCVLTQSDTVYEHQAATWQYPTVIALDSAQIYGIARPTVNMIFNCTDCTGNPPNQFTGGLVTWTGKMWRRNF